MGSRSPAPIGPGRSAASSAQPRVARGAANGARPPVALVTITLRISSGEWGPIAELGPLGEDRSQLAISARYRPPLGVVGRAVDRVLLHRVAEATLKDFLDRVGEAITNRPWRDEATRPGHRAGVQQLPGQHPRPVRVSETGAGPGTMGP